MTRRVFLPAAAAAGMGGALGAVPVKRSVIEMRTIKLRNSGDEQRQRTTDFLRQSAMPALLKAGARPLAYFAGSIAADTPFLITLTTYPSLSAMEEIREKLTADKDYQTALVAYNTAPGIGYQRIDSSLLRCFDKVPTLLVPPSDAKRPSRIFELRTYESNNATTLRRKIQMFNDSEIGIFERLGMQPVFFGETLVGQNMPSLTYMLAFDDLAAREKAWRAFGADPEWQTLRAKPGLSDAEIVSNISNSILQPLPFSPLK